MSPHPCIRLPHRCNTNEALALDEGPGSSLSHNGKGGLPREVRSDAAPLTLLPQVSKFKHEPARC